MVMQLAISICALGKNALCENILGENTLAEGAVL
jgi:hypothetical protein